MEMYTLTVGRYPDDGRTKRMEMRMRHMHSHALTKRATTAQRRCIAARASLLAMPRQWPRRPGEAARPTAVWSAWLQRCGDIA